MPGVAGTPGEPRRECDGALALRRGMAGVLRNPARAANAEGDSHKEVEEMRKLLSISSNLLLTTTLTPFPTPRPSDWWYYGLDHGQHIGFYRVKTLEYLAKEFNLKPNILAHAFVLSRPFLSSNIMGVTTLDQIKENIVYRQVRRKIVS
mgnify:CR=1 FL=1